MADRTPEAHKALVAALKAHAGLSALVGARVYDRAPQDVAYPWVQIGEAVSSDFDGSAGLRGMDLVIRVHCWSRAVGMVECRRMLAEVRDALHRVDLTLDAGTLVLCRVSGMRDLRDPDDVTAHGIADITIITDG